MAEEAAPPTKSDLWIARLLFGGLTLVGAIMPLLVWNYIPPAAPSIIDPITVYTYAPGLRTGNLVISPQTTRVNFESVDSLLAARREQGGELYEHTAKDVDDWRNKWVVTYYLFRPNGPIYAATVMISEDAPILSGRHVIKSYRNGNAIFFDVHSDQEQSDSIWRYVGFIFGIVGIIAFFSGGAGLMSIACEDESTPAQPETQ
jgi:hypothetical protein